MKSIYCSLLSILVLLTKCSNASTQNDPIPVHETFTIQSNQLGEVRTINIWTPTEYKANTDSLPVLYMPDGGIKEDFPHIAHTIAGLVKSKKIRPIILVGIENTQRRRDLTGKTQVEKDREIAAIVGGSEKFRAFIKFELFSEVNKRYRTSNETGIIGESLAGLFVTETFLSDPDMFDFYIAFDPSLWWNDKHLIKTANEQLAKFPRDTKKLWLASSGATGISTAVDQLSDILKSNNIQNLKWHYSPEPKEAHNTIFRATKEKAIIWTLN